MPIYSQFPRRALAGAALLCGLALAQSHAGPLGTDEVTLTAAVYRPVAVYRSNVAEVQLDVRVTDERDQPVPGLGKSDFQLRDNGAVQAITSFVPVDRGGSESASENAPHPLSLATRTCAPLKTPHAVLFYFDDLDTEGDGLMYGRGKALAYLARSECAGGLRPGETVAVVAGSGVGNVDFSRDVGRIRNALMELKPRPRVSSDKYCPLITAFQAWEILQGEKGFAARQLAGNQATACHACLGAENCTAYIEGRADDIWREEMLQTRLTLELLRNAVELLGRQPGNRTLVLTATGFLGPEQEPALQKAQQDLINVALSDGVVIDSVDARGVIAPAIAAGGPWNDPVIKDGKSGMFLNSWRSSWDAGGFSSRDAALSELASATGGNFLHDNNDLLSAYENDVDGIETYYRLGFTPTGLKADGSLHHLKVQVIANGRYTVASRQGYLAPSPLTTAPPTDDQPEINAAVLGSSPRSTIECALIAEAVPEGVHAILRLNPNTLSFQDLTGRHLDHLTLVFALLTSDGQFFSGQQAQMDLRLTDAGLRYVSTAGVGLNAGLTLPAPAGDYLLRVVALESATHAWAVTGAPVNVGTP